MNESSMCSGNFSLDELRSEYSKYRSRQSQEKKRKFEIHGGVTPPGEPDMKMKTEGVQPKLTFSKFVMMENLLKKPYQQRIHP